PHSPPGEIEMPHVSRGCLYRRPRSENWFIKFRLDGQVKRESAHTPDRERALEYLRRRTANVIRSVGSMCNPRSASEPVCREPCAPPPDRDAARGERA